MSIWTVFLVFPFIVGHCVPLQVLCGIYTSPWLYLVWLLWSKVHTFHPLPDTQDKNTQAPGQCGQVKYPSTHPCPPDSSPHTWHGPKVHGAGGRGGLVTPVQSPGAGTVVTPPLDQGRVVGHRVNTFTENSITHAVQARGTQGCHVKQLVLTILEMRNKSAQIKSI